MMMKGGDTMNIGMNIRTLRQQKGLTQEQTAAQLGVTAQAVSKWETGANTPDIALLPALAELFGVSIDALFGRELPPMPEGLPQEDDGVIRVVQMRGRQVLAVTPRMSPDDPAIEIAFPRNCNDRTQYFKVEVYGHVIADGSINGDVVYHQSVECGEINGNVRTRGNVTASSINTFGPIVCSGIYDCYNLQANRIECSGTVSAINLTCGQITQANPPEMR